MPSLPTRKIGDANVTAIGWGAMGIAGVYGAPKPDEERLKFIDKVYELGCTNWDTADLYGDSEALIGKWLKKTGKRNEIFLATKFGFALGDPTRPHGINGTPEHMRRQINQSLTRLGVDYVDLYYLHRPDSTIPIEVTIGAMAELVKEGKVKYLGISECSEKTLRRAHAVHPISAVQVEYNPFTLDPEDEKIGIFKACKELGIALVAYSPLGRGIITGRYKGPEDFDKTDIRLMIPRFSKENFPNILKLSDGLKELGHKYNATAGQITLAWLLAQSDNVIPIPGTSTIKYVEENLGALHIKLSPEDVAEVRKIAEHANAAQGTRNPTAFIHLQYVDTPEL
ncbi:NADP-dependent oxidoreductase domain-containing protein [Abortiporus biennis]|nr:NADP-dependent oxidoreductase domain-containing protein [Abortiporus biennis]